VAGLPRYRPGRTPADVAAEHGLDAAIKLASNEAPFGPLESVRAVIAEATAHVNRYPDAKAQPLRAAIAERTGMPVERVTVGAGSSGLLWQLGEAYLDPGDELLIPWPSFEAYPIIAQLMDAMTVRAPLHGQCVDVDALLQRLTPRTKLIVVADPNNPTGTALPGADLERLAEGTAGRAILVIDEAYLEFRTRADATDALALVRRFDHVLALRSFSKAYGLAGLRVGFAVGPKAVIDYLDRVAVPFSVSSLGQAAALASLAAEAELRVRVANVLAERSRVVDGLAALGWDVPDPQANFVLLPAGERTTGLAQRLEQAGIITREFPHSGVRVTIGDRAENDRFLACLAADTPTRPPTPKEARP
jgi:histidinol-phosphate aminotransferase